MFLWGPPVRAGVRLDAPTLFDVAPTALYLMGLPVARDMDGRVLTEAFEPSLMASRSPSWVASYDDGSRLGGTVESAVDEEVLRELEALGYIR
jgi:arylsulfatase A-like enzyme